MNTNLTVRVIPNAKQDRFDGWLTADTIKIRLKAPPNDGKANEALVGYLSKVLGVPRNHIEIRSGHTSRTKRILIMDCTLTAIKDLLSAQ